MVETLIAFAIYANQARIQAHISTIVPSLELSLVAQDRANYLCTHQFSHNDLVFSFIKYKRFGPAHAQGENLAKGFTDDQSIQQAWLNSLSHKKNMLDPRWTSIGIGRACGVTVEVFD